MTGPFNIFTICSFGILHYGGLCWPLPQTSRTLPTATASLSYIFIFSRFSRERLAKSKEDFSRERLVISKEDFSWERLAKSKEDFSRERLAKSKEDFSRERLTKSKEDFQEKDWLKLRKIFQERYWLNLRKISPAKNIYQTLVTGAMIG